MNERESNTPERGAASISRFQSRILEGIGAAHREEREIDPGTARLIAHVLGRAVGADSELATYGRSGIGDYDAMRHEYLDLYEAPETPAQIREWIDWLGTYLLNVPRGEGTGEASPHAAPPVPLLADELMLGEQPVAVHVPGTITGPELQEVVARLTPLHEACRHAVEAFLSLSDVDASAPDIATIFRDAYVGSFGSHTEALRVVTPIEDWEAELAEWARSQGLDPGAVTLNLDAIDTVAQTAYDFVERGGQIHVFTR